ncbi:MAG: hypothetical protein E7L17_10390 [Clostridium sp.]|uniref:hypothetical protein n=1 Tax=Clostridium sp. TaxID=1506 RepID=UPI002914FEF6|nr:hypothetical protein [Clostridium sp.]MDU7338507.1 hypothetical protein [Clostridium sp.]
MNQKKNLQLKLINHTLNNIVKNQALLYLKMDEVDKRLQQLSTLERQAEKMNGREQK